jgi:hypothetical protein
MVSQTDRIGWNVLRGAVTSSDSSPTYSATTLKNANIPSHAKTPNKNHNAVEINFAGGANGQSATVYVWAARKSGDIVLVWTATVTAGPQVATDGSYYVDTIASSTDNWITTVAEVDGGGDNRMARIVFDTCGYNQFWVTWDGVSSETFYANISGY